MWKTYCKILEGIITQELPVAEQDKNLNLPATIACFALIHSLKWCLTCGLEEILVYSNVSHQVIVMLQFFASTAEHVLTPIQLILTVSDISQTS